MLAELVVAVCVVELVKGADDVELVRVVGVERTDCVIGRIDEFVALVGAGLFCVFVVVVLTRGSVVVGEDVAGLEEVELILARNCAIN